MAKQPVGKYPQLDNGILNPHDNGIINSDPNDQTHGINSDIIAWIIQLLMSGSGTSGSSADIERILAYLYGNALDDTGKNNGMTNILNWLMTKYSNQYAKDEAELAYSRSLPTTQLSQLMAAGMSRQAALAMLQGSQYQQVQPTATTFSPDDPTSRQLQQKQNAISAVGAAASMIGAVGQGVSSITSAVGQGLTNWQLDKQNEGLKLLEPVLKEVYSWKTKYPNMKVPPSAMLSCETFKDWCLKQPEDSAPHQLLYSDEWAAMAATPWGANAFRTEFRANMQGRTYIGNEHDARITRMQNAANLHATTLSNLVAKPQALAAEFETLMGYTFRVPHYGEDGNQDGYDLMNMNLLEVRPEGSIEFDQDGNYVGLNPDSSVQWSYTDKDGQVVTVNNRLDSEVLSSLQDCGILDANGSPTATAPLILTNTMLRLQQEFEELTYCTDPDFIKSKYEEMRSNMAYQTLYNVVCRNIWAGSQEAIKNLTSHKDMDWIGLFNIFNQVGFKYDNITGSSLNTANGLTVTASATTE